MTPIPHSESKRKTAYWQAVRHAIQVQWGWLLHYKLANLPADLIAGAMVATLLIPQSMAYALLAGLPPIVGLYTGILPVFIYGFLASGTVLTFGPTAITAVMVLSTVAPLATPGSDPYAAYVLTLTLALGLVFVLMGLLRTGFLANLLSRPVMTGYVNAAALTIAFSQFANLLGIRIPYTSQAHELLLEPLRRLHLINPVTLLLSMLSIALLLYFRHWLPGQLERWRWPVQWVRILPRLGPLITVLVLILLTALLRLDTTADVRIIGAIPSGLPTLGFAGLDLSQVGALLPGVLAIALVGFMEAVSTLQSLPSNSPQRFDANQELLAMGAANLASGLSGGFAATTSISRTAVNAASGARTGLSSMMAAGLLALTVLFFAPIFYYLPNATLAAIVIVAVVRLLDFASIARLWRYSRIETLPFWVTFAASLFVGIEVGIFGGTLLMLAVHLVRTVRPQITTLGNIPGSDQYRELDADTPTETAQHTLILRPDESLYFANARYLNRYVLNEVAQRPQVKYVILVCSSVNRMDGSALQLLAELAQGLTQRGVRLLFADFKPSVQSRFVGTQFSDQIGIDRIYARVHDAMLAIRKWENEDESMYAHWLL